MPRWNSARPPFKMRAVAIIAIQPPRKDEDRVDALIERVAVVVTIIVVIMFVVYVLTEYVL